ncbi:unnamed protein product [Urochloa humidicola]
MADEAATSSSCPAAMMKKKAANRLVVEEATTVDESSVCNMHPAIMKELSILCGDIVLLKGKRRRDTVCMAISISNRRNARTILALRLVRRRL